MGERPAMIKTGAGIAKPVMRSQLFSKFP